MTKPTPNLNQLGTDLRDTIVSVDAEIAAVQERLDKLKTRRAMLVAWLNEETVPGQAAAATQKAVPVPPAPAASIELPFKGTPLAIFLQSKLAQGPLHTEDLATMAQEAGLIEKGKSAKRSVSAVMQSLVNAKTIVPSEAGWRLKHPV